MPEPMLRLDLTGVIVIHYLPLQHKHKHMMALGISSIIAEHCPESNRTIVMDAPERSNGDGAVLVWMRDSKLPYCLQVSGSCRRASGYVAAKRSSAKSTMRTILCEIIFIRVRRHLYLQSLAVYTYKAIKQSFMIYQ
jgi:hypothetical protein